MLLSLLLAGGCPRSTPTPPSSAPLEAPEDVAVAFWRRLAQRDAEGAAALATFPFDLDAHAGCILTVTELTEALDAEPLPAELEMVIGGARRVDDGDSGLDPAWSERLARFTSPDAPCVDAATVGAGELSVSFVDFTVNGDPVGALTRVRCRDGCRVAGIDN